MSSNDQVGVLRDVTGQSQKSILVFDASTIAPKVSCFRQLFHDQSNLLFLDSWRLGQAANEGANGKLRGWIHAVSPRLSPINIGGESDSVGLLANLAFERAGARPLPRLTNEQRLKQAYFLRQLGFAFTCCVVGGRVLAIMREQATAPRRFA